jgi:hypothetical protein
MEFTLYFRRMKLEKFLRFIYARGVRSMRWLIRWLIRWVMRWVMRCLVRDLRQGPSHDADPGARD